GLDVGGAHLKAAQVTPDGRIVRAMQVPCQLWRGLDRLEAALIEVEGALTPDGPVGVTMTGELVDLFADRRGGVEALLSALVLAWPERKLAVWSGDRGFVAPENVVPEEVASANWLATAAVVAKRVGEGALVDLGSTTTDIVLLTGGRPAAQATTDRDRLAAGELVYVGLTRTPVMALTAEAPFGGRRVPLMNELFATSADLFRVLGTLPEPVDQHPAADNGEKTAKASARRLARMLGADLADGSPDDWRRLAGWLAGMLLRRIEDALALQLSRGLVGEEAPLVGAGCGRFLVERLTAGRPYRDFATLLDCDSTVSEWVSTCAPAVAVALLLAEARRG
ncbi:MAG: hydantoinase/oxoprolinase family protein, partial [Geminicoccaceae bacterium]